MAKPDAEGAGSDTAELKAMMKLAHRGAVHVALALGGDGKAAIKMDKLKPPKALEKMLKEADPKIKKSCHGTVEIDPDDPKTAKFTVNKAVSGLRAKLIMALKGTGVTQIEISSEDGSPAEDGPGDADGAEETGADAGASGGAGRDQGGATYAADSDTPLAAGEPDDGDAAGHGADGGAGRSGPAGADEGGATYAADADTPLPTSGGPDPGAGAPSGQAGPDAGTLAKQLTGLVKQMMGVIAGDPSQKAALGQLAVTAQGALKQGDLQGAAESVANLKQALASAGGAGTQPAAEAPVDQAAAPAAPDDAGPSPADTPAGKAHAKAGVAWKATHGKMSGELDKLTGSFSDAFKDHPQAAALQQAFKEKIDGVLGKLDHSLSDKLAEVGQAKDAAAHSRIVAEAKQIMTRYQQVVSSDPTIAAIDNNPFAPVSIQKTLTATLTTLAKVIQ